MFRKALVLWLLLLPNAVDAQTVCKASMYCPPMLVERAGLGLMLCAEEPMELTVTWPSGKTLSLPCVLPPTYARGRLTSWTVDAVTGIGESGGSRAVLRLPPEPVRWRRGGMVALAITARGTLTVDGQAGDLTVWFGDCPVRRRGIGRFEADELIAPGEVVFP